MIAVTSDLRLLFLSQNFSKSPASDEMLGHCMVTEYPGNDTADCNVTRSHQRVPEDQTALLRWVTETLVLTPLIVFGLVGNTIAFVALCSRGCRGRRRQWHMHRELTVLLRVSAWSAAIYSIIASLGYNGRTSWSVAQYSPRRSQ